jgi:hypothetical protein
LVKEKRTDMKIISILSAAAVLALAACSTLRTTADYDRSADFSKYHTFAVQGAQTVKNALLERRIKSALESELSAKGLKEDDANPDLLVVPHVRLTHETEITTFDEGWGYGWRWRRGGVGGSVSTVEKIPVGTLIIDLVDAREKDMVWRGTATDTLKPSATPQEKEKSLGEAVAKMFQSFPPAA